MDSALNQLKVPDLKRILADAAVAAPSRATKADLVARILDSPAAQAVYRAQYRPDADPPAEPQHPPTPAPAPEPAPPPAPAAAPAPSPPKAPTAEDPELEKRKARADRFGIPLVNPPPDDEAKLKARAQRFGIDNTKKRAAPEPVNAEELEKRKKRAERFGTKVPVRLLRPHTSTSSQTTQDASS